MNSIIPEHQFKVDKIEVLLFADKQMMGAAAAAFVIEQLRQAISTRGSASLVVATGNSQHDFLIALRRAHNIDWRRVTMFHLDEYLGLPTEHPASFRRYLHEWLIDHVSFRTVHLLNGDSTDPQAECRRYAELLSEQDIDVACIGIGENGHLAFNDPPADFHTSELVHIVTLDDACRRQQVGEGHFKSIAEVATQALSLSIPAILSARVISCVAPEQRKADAVACALEGPITPECPASVLRTHPACRLYLDAASASKLSSKPT